MIAIITIILKNKVIVMTSIVLLILTIIYNCNYDNDCHSIIIIMIMIVIFIITIIITIMVIIIISIISYVIIILFFYRIRCCGLSSNEILPRGTWSHNELWIETKWLTTSILRFALFTCFYLSLFSISNIVLRLI